MIADLACQVSPEAIADALVPSVAHSERDSAHVRREAVRLWTLYAATPREDTAERAAAAGRFHAFVAERRLPYADVYHEALIFLGTAAVHDERERQEARR